MGKDRQASAYLHGLRNADSPRDSVLGWSRNAGVRCVEKPQTNGHEILHIVSFRKETEASRMSPIEQYIERLEAWICDGSVWRALFRGALVFLPIIVLGTWLLKRMFG